MLLASSLHTKLQNKVQVPRSTVGRSPPIKSKPLDHEISITIAAEKI